MLRCFMEKQFFKKVKKGLGTQKIELLALGEARARGRGAERKTLHLRQKERSKKRQIFIDFSWPIPKCLIWTESTVSLNYPHPEG